MKNVGMKAESYRTAVATGILHAPSHCIELLRNGNTEKGDALKFATDISKTLKNKLYEKKHIVIIHRERKLDEEIASLLKVIEIKNYGRSKIIFGVFN